MIKKTFAFRDPIKYFESECPELGRSWTANECQFLYDNGLRHESVYYINSRNRVRIESPKNNNVRSYEICRSNHQSCSVKKVVLKKNFIKFTGKHLYQIVPQPATLLKKRLQHRCYPTDFVKFLRTPFLQKTSGACFWMCKIQLLKSYDRWTTSLSHARKPSQMGFYCLMNDIKFSATSSPPDIGKSMLTS